MLEEAVKTVAASQGGEGGGGGGKKKVEKKKQVEFITWKKRSKNLWINPRGQCLLSLTPAGGAGS